MISLLLYGRNDTHGYNLHRRVALSLNCLAEVLTDEDDEIVFVDWATPDELPTLVEALADTLTERCLEVLRVLRVPASLHMERYAPHTHLPIVEPVSRNVAARQANPANRWLLSTNTDMILLPLAGSSLSDACSDLADGFYGLPRFELPEWLWEQLPRSDPRTALAEVARLGPGLRLDEATISHEWIRFDAPGDFQLVLREDFVAIDGFDEAMLLGWHVDSNLSRRMSIQRGSIESLEDDVAGYHCNHNRIPTVYHGAERPANDLNRFVYSLDRAPVPAQRESWGLAGVEVEEVQLRRRVGTHFANSVFAAVADGPSARVLSDAREAKFALDYDSGHVLPFVADALVVSPPEARVAYVGGNAVLERMLASLVETLGLGGPLLTVRFRAPGSLEALDRDADVLVVDLGVDTSLGLGESNGSEAEGLSEARAKLVRTFDALRRLVDLERERLRSGQHPRRFLLVNSAAVFWNAFVLAHMYCSPTTPHSRVRHATVKPEPDADAAAEAANVRALRLIRWIARRDLDRRRLKIHLDTRLDIAELDEYSGFGRGWTYPEQTAILTRGPRSHLALSVAERCTSKCVLELTLGSVGVQPGEQLQVEMSVNSTPVAHRSFDHSDQGVTWSIDLPARTLANGAIDLVLALEQPESRRGAIASTAIRLSSLVIWKSSLRRRLAALDLAPKTYRVM